MGDHYSEMISDMDLLRTLGCGIFTVAPWLRRLFCSPQFFRLRAWCPQACGCAGVVDDTCPSQCRNATELVLWKAREDQSADACDLVSAGNKSSILEPCTLAGFYTTIELVSRSCCSAADTLVEVYLANQ